MSTYKDLQVRAKELGLPYIGVPREDLEKSITNHQSESSTDSVSSVKEAANATVASKPTQESGPEATVAAKASLKNANTAIVSDGKREIRRYSVELHGSDFADLAQQFADKFHYQVELVTLEDGIICPACGHKFVLEKQS